VALAVGEEKLLSSGRQERIQTFTKRTPEWCTRLGSEGAAAWFIKLDI